MVIDWFSFFFGAMSLVLVEFIALIAVGVNVYRKQQGAKKK